MAQKRSGEMGFTRARIVTWTTEDILFGFIREFAVRGELFGTATYEGKHERIRVAIWSHRRDTLPFHDSGMTYAQAFQRIFNRPLELREKARYDPRVVVVDDIDDDDGDEDDAEITSDNDEEFEHG
jgi:hypothetical protein